MKIRTAPRSSRAGHVELGLLSFLFLSTLGAIGWLAQEGKPDVEQTLRDVGAANRVLRASVAEPVTGALPPKRFDPDALLVTSLSDGLIIVGLPARAPEDDPPDEARAAQKTTPELGVIILSGSSTDVPAPAIRAGVYRVAQSGSVVELRGPDGRLAASVPVLNDRPLDSGSPSTNRDWSLAYLSIVRHLSRTSAR